MAIQQGSAFILHSKWQLLYFSSNKALQSNSPVHKQYIIHKFIKNSARFYDRNVNVSDAYLAGYLKIKLNQ